MSALVLEPREAFNAVQRGVGSRAAAKPRKAELEERVGGFEKCESTARNSASPQSSIGLRRYNILSAVGTLRN